MLFTQDAGKSKTFSRYSKQRMTKTSTNGMEITNVHEVARKQRSCPKVFLIFKSPLKKRILFACTVSFSPLLNHSYFFVKHKKGNFLFPAFQKIKAIKIYQNIDILKNYSNHKNNDAASYERKTTFVFLDCCLCFLSFFFSGIE